MATETGISWLLSIMEKWQLQQLQALPLEVKIKKTQERIKEWYEHWNGQVYVSFSGGKDSTVLLHIARTMYPDVDAIFVDTGLEYPEVRRFALSFDNVARLTPEMNFKKVIDTYGFPLISKEVSRDIYFARSKPDGKTAQKFIRGSDYHKKYGDAWLLEKWSDLKDSNIPISNQCCNVMKKKPVKKYGKESGKVPIIATMACESRLRKKEYLTNGCNAFDKGNPSSQPMSFWTEQDVLQYITEYQIKYASVYGEVQVDKNGKYYTTGCDRTGCMFCMYGVQCEKEPNRFQRMKKTHPKQYNYCINKLGIGKVLDYIGVKY